MASLERKIICTFSKDINQTYRYLTTSEICSWNILNIYSYHTFVQSEDYHMTRLPVNSNSFRLSTDPSSNFTSLYTEDYHMTRLAVYYNSYRLSTDPSSIFTVLYTEDYRMTRLPVYYNSSRLSTDLSSIFTSMYSENYHMTHFLENYIFFTLKTVAMILSSDKWQLNRCFIFTIIYDKTAKWPISQESQN